MTCGAICGEEVEEVARRPDGDERWCFRCRAKQSFVLVVIAPVRLSYYGPTPRVECTTCRLTDGDLFPGYEREWED